MYTDNNLPHFYWWSVLRWKNKLLQYWVKYSQLHHFLDFMLNITFLVVVHINLNYVMKPNN